MKPDPRLSELLETLIAKWREKSDALGREANADYHHDKYRSAYCDGKSMGIVHCLTELRAAVLLGGTPQPLPDDPPTVLTIEVEREDDGRCCASWVTGDRKEAGSGEYSPTIVGALANLCATLIKVDEDKAIERAACGGAASSPTPACRFMQPNQTAPCSEVRPGEEATWCMACLLSHQPAAPVRPVQETP